MQYNMCMNVLFNLQFYMSNSFSLSMTMLIKMQRTLVVFSLTLMLTVRVLFIFLRRWINSNLFELIHLNKNMKRNERSRLLFFENSLSVYTEEWFWYNMVCIKNSISLHKYSSMWTLLKSPFLDSWTEVFWLLSIFLKQFFSPLFLWVVDIVCAQNCCFL